MMRRILIGNRILVLDSVVRIDDTHTYGAIFKYSNPNELKHFVDKFISHNDLANGCIYFHNEELLWQQFTQLYEVSPLKDEGDFVLKLNK